MRVRQHRLKVVYRSSKQDIVHIVCHFPDSIEILPGQFFQLLPGENIDLFLPRPISVMDYHDGRLEFLIRVRGKGTARLAFGEERELIAIGPLGKGFSLPQEPKEVILLAGGMGVAPLIFWERYLIRKDVTYRFFWGLADRNSYDCFPVMPKRAELFTQDGSAGRKGTVVDVLDELSADVFYVCGPLPMMEAVYSRLKEKGVRAQFCLESRMACGWGGCKGCYIEFAGRSLYVCKEGPVVEVVC